MFSTELGLFTASPRANEGKTGVTVAVEEKVSELWRLRPCGLARMTLAERSGSTVGEVAAPSRKTPIRSGTPWSSRDSLLSLQLWLLEHSVQNSMNIHNHFNNSLMYLEHRPEAFTLRFIQFKPFWIFLNSGFDFLPQKTEHLRGSSLERNNFT